eukprot:TRINITY_DN15041_c0_g1_i1.p1 TRINITY_DN15041_c0_g1~~TRINITY_DN15041_c0_g1_i1.p1  ORF type:complete len:480 (+),score=39.87 TRINITY_DN15041_c0_g1_i1:318-1757(+)
MWVTRGGRGGARTPRLLTRFLLLCSPHCTRGVASPGSPLPLAPRVGGMFTWLAGVLLGGAAGDQELARDVLQPVLAPQTLLTPLVDTALKWVVAVGRGELPDGAIAGAVGDAVAQWVLQRLTFLAALWAFLHSGISFCDVAARRAGDADALASHYHSYLPLSLVFGWVRRRLGGPESLWGMFVPLTGAARGAELARAASAASVRALCSSVVERHAVATLSAAASDAVLALWAPVPDGHGLGARLVSALAGLMVRAAGAAVGHALWPRGGWGAHVGGVVAHWAWRSVFVEPARDLEWSCQRRRLRLCAPPAAGASPAAPAAAAPSAAAPSAAPTQAHADHFARPQIPRTPPPRPGPGFGLTEDDVRDGQNAAMSGVDYYSVLGVHQTASQKEITAAYRAQSKAHHPDHGGDEERQKAINEAYCVLHSVRVRAVYDWERRVRSLTCAQLTCAGGCGAILAMAMCQWGMFRIHCSLAGAASA